MHTLQSRAFVLLSSCEKEATNSNSLRSSTFGLRSCSATIIISTVDILPQMIMTL